MLAAVDHDLLPLEGRVEIGDDADSPRLAEMQRLRRGAILSPLTERALVELVLGRLLDPAAARAGSVRPFGRDDDLPSGERVAPELRRQLLPPPRAPSANACRRSIGAGKTIVVDCDEPSSSSVWR